MPTLLDTQLSALYSQHSLQNQDLLTIVTLAKAEDVVDNIETYGFDDFLGLTIHLFVTTQSQQVREQLALKLPKFGSAVVLPLVKILCRMQTRDQVQLLAQQSLDKMVVYPLIIGLGQVLDRETDETLRTTAVHLLTKLVQENDQSFLLVIPKLVSSKTWHLLKLQLLETLPYPKFNTECFSDKKSHKSKKLSLC